MALKPRKLRRIFLFTATVLAVLAASVVLIPPMFTLNRLKPQMQAAIMAQTGTDAVINGDVHFSLIAGATIVARDITVPGGRIGAVAVRVPMTALFDLSHATLAGRVSVYDADVEISRLTPATANHDIEMRNCRVMFLGKEYRIISGYLGNGEFQATVRTDQHKYDVTLTGDEFVVSNRNNELTVMGNLTATGGARGTMSLKTDNVNRMFEFSDPKIPGTFDLEMRFDWDGGYGVKFSDIHSDNFTGNIDIAPDGRRRIQITSSDITFDFSFLLFPSRLINETSFDLDLRGRLTLGRREFKHLMVRAVGTPSALTIEKIVADDIVITGGEITADGAKDLMITTRLAGRPITCLMSGTPDAWGCEKFTYRGMTGSMRVVNNTFEITVSSKSPMPAEDEVRTLLKQVAPRGTVKFIFSDAAGTLYMDGEKIRPEFKFAHDRRLDWLRGGAEILPEFMHDEIGDFALNDGRVTFRPHNNRWEITTENEAFAITGRSMHDWFPDMDLSAINDDEYFISGLKRGDVISNLTIRTMGHEFTGSVTGKNITLKTDTLNIDAFVSQNFIDNYAEMEFFTDAPIMLPFGLGVNISLHADNLIYNGETYKNFVYSLKNNTQTYSITDNERGNLLAIITKNNKDYDISVQVSRFKTSGALLAADMPLNVRDATITGEIEMRTSGVIAHDIEYNLTGSADITLADATLVGIGIDDFYASAENVTTLNAEYAIADALTDGETYVKEMHVAGDFAGGDFETTAPLTIEMRHSAARGSLAIRDGRMTADLTILMRATSPDPTPVSLTVMPDGARRYSLSEIMLNFDPGFMRQFIRTHMRF